MEQNAVDTCDTTAPITPFAEQVGDETGGCVGLQTATYQLRLMRANGTEINAPADRIVFESTDWTFAVGGFDSDGNPIFTSMTNNIAYVFPGPGLLDLGSAVSHVDFVIAYDPNPPEPQKPDYTPFRSDGMLLLNFLTTVLGVTKVSFAPGQLVLKPVS